MQFNVTFFSDDEELLRLTGLPSRKDLWNNGFNLDDMDFGIVIDYDIDLADEHYDEENWVPNGHHDYDDTNIPYFMDWLLWRMRDHCVGYNKVKYGGRYYYTVHHS